MSKQVAIKGVKELIRSTKDAFEKYDSVDFKAEALFATQLCERNECLRNVALNNPVSLRMAMLNVAAVGLTLNPAQGLAYLVPRNGQVILDISYRGLIAIASESGSIMWAKAELVYEKDTFRYLGPMNTPVHECDPFDPDRGAVRGGYCMAKLPDGSVMTEAMSFADMEKIRMSSMAGKDNLGPWVTWPDQMQLKSVVKRAYKWWPRPCDSRMATALTLLNERNGEGLAVVTKDVTAEQREQIIASLPPAPDRAKVDPAVVALVDNLIDRGRAAGAFAPCFEIVQARVKDPEGLSYALSELEQAKSEHLAA